MVDYYDPLTISALGGNLLSSIQDPNIAKGLYSPVNISQHATSAANAANIASEGFKAGKPGWAGASKIYSSPSADVYKHYGTSKIGMVTPEGNRLPWGGGISKHGVNLSTAGESAMGIEKANRARLFYNKLAGGAYSNSPLAQRLLQTGKTYSGGIGNFLSKFRGVGNILGKIGLTAPIMDAYLGPTDEGFRTTKAFVDPIKTAGSFIKKIINPTPTPTPTTQGGGGGPPGQPSTGPHIGYGGGQGGGGQGGGGGQAAGQRPSRTSRGAGLSAARRASRPSGYAAVRRYGRYRGGLTGYNRGGIVSLL